MIVAMMVLASLTIVAPPGTDAAVKERQDAWNACLKTFTTNGSLTNDPSDVVADAALYSCDTEQRNYEFEWRTMLLARSITIQTLDGAKETAARTIAEFVVTKRKDLIVDIQYQRQIEALRRKSSELKVQVR